MSANANDPSGGDYTAKPVYFSGFNINATAGSRTAFNADLKLGMVLQLDPYITQSCGSGPVLPGLGQRVSTPTAAQRGNFFIVGGAPSPSMNDLAGADTAGTTTANLRKGGEVKGIFQGDKVQALVAQSGGGALSIGQDLAPGTGAVLVATTPTSVAEGLARVGATARAWATLLETVATGSGNVLAWVQINQN